MNELQNVSTEECVTDKKEENIPLKINFTIMDVFLSLASILVVFFSLKMIQTNAGGIWITLLTIVVCSVVYLYAKKKQLKITKVSYAYLLYNLLLGLSFSFFENTLFLGFNLIFLILSNIYWILTIGHSRKTSTLDNRILNNLLHSLFILPFKKVQETFSIYYFNKNKNIHYILLGVLISLPLLWVVINLLSSADKLFDSWVSTVTIRFSDNIYENLVLFLFSIPIGYYVFLFLYRNLMTEDLIIETKKIIKKPSAIFITILTIFIIIYLLFFISSMFSFFEFQKETITAEAISLYARDGFFQLVIVALINVGIFTVVRIFGDQDSFLIKILLSFIGSETLGLIFIAFGKMLLYISKFGLTLMRYNTSIFMLVLFLCITFFILGLWKQFNYVGYSIVAIAFTVLAVSYQNVGNFIVSHNYQQFKEQKIEELDVSVFYTLGIDAVPIAVQIYMETSNEKVKTDMEIYLNDMEMFIASDASHSISYSKKLATNQMNEFRKETNNE